MSSSMPMSTGNQANRTIHVYLTTRTLSEAEKGKYPELANRINILDFKFDETYKNTTLAGDNYGLGEAGFTVLELHRNKAKDHVIFHLPSKSTKEYVDVQALLNELKQDPVSTDSKTPPLDSRGFLKMSSVYLSKKDGDSYIFVSDDVNTRDNDNTLSENRLLQRFTHNEASRMQAISIFSLIGNTKEAKIRQNPANYHPLLGISIDSSETTSN